ncbi:hypothetical protein BCR44DRAFT_177981 [Catenaria anguillulae PL171]|uniref:Secreted protein n=1 Tax=Catenaria anguillulae PL171 TaxID=765915 RepID=A0A1Y2H963_9FUNG|nr:hypothetical protein BCR44DRAFT_177981 [Catenaria anguillulae PL171]
MRLRQVSALALATLKPTLFLPTVTCTKPVTCDLAVAAGAHQFRSQLNRHGLICLPSRYVVIVAMQLSPWTLPNHHHCRTCAPSCPESALGIRSCCTRNWAFSARVCRATSLCIDCFPFSSTRCPFDTPL